MTTRLSQLWWDDWDLGHNFHATKQSERDTLSPPARYTVLDHLPALNHRRYAEEANAGRHDKKVKKPASCFRQRLNPKNDAPQQEFLA